MLFCGIRGIGTGFGASVRGGFGAGVQASGRQLVRVRAGLEGVGLSKGEGVGDSRSWQGGSRSGRGGAFHG